MNDTSTRSADQWQGLDISSDVSEGKPGRFINREL
jgi:hypothetical protein